MSPARNAPAGESEELLDPVERRELLVTLEARFQRNLHRHPAFTWQEVASCLEAHPGRLWSLHRMEATGGEPDLVGRDEETGALLFVDCAPESPVGRRSLCYDPAALEARKKHKPAGSAEGMAAAMGAELLTESEYRHLQEFEPFDTKTSSWLRTPSGIRELGGAIVGDFRYGTVFI